MPPKGSKRAATGALSGAALKKAKRSEKRREAIISSLEDAESLSETCRGMLVAALPGSLGAAPAERDPIQTEMVALIEKALKGEQERLLSENQSAGAEITTVSDETKKCEDDQKGLEDALTASTADIAAKEEKLAADTSAEEQSIQQAADAKSALESLEGELKEIADAKEALEKVNAGDFMLLKDSPPADKRTAKAHVRSVEKAIQPLGVDEALLVGAPLALAKDVAKRGPFDAVVMEQVAGVFAAEIGKLAERLAGSEQEKAEKTAAVESTKAMQEAATAQKNSSTEALSSAKSEKVELEAKLKAAQHLAKDLAKRTKEVATAAARKAKENADFKEVYAGFYVERDGEPEVEAVPPAATLDAAPAVVAATA